MTWEPQIRTNLDDPLYHQQLDSLLGNVPGAHRAALVNTRFHEACARAPGEQAVDAGELQSLVSLTLGLFGGEGEVAATAFEEAFAGIGAIEAAYVCFREETLLLTRLPTNRLLALTVSASVNQGACGTLLRTLADRIGSASEDFAALVEADAEVLLAALIDLAGGRILERYERYGDLSVLELDDDLAAVLTSLFGGARKPRGLTLAYRSGEPLAVRRAELVTAGRSIHWGRIPFDPEHLMVLSVERTTVRGLVWTMLRRSEIEVVRVWVDGLLRYGIASTMSPFPETQKEFLEIVDQLRDLDENDLLGRLDLGGFANYTVGEGYEMQRCQECIYYLPHARWCDLPELPLPVEPHWWCRLWKI